MFLLDEQIDKQIDRPKVREPTAESYPVNPKLKNPRPDMADDLDQAIWPGFFPPSRQSPRTLKSFLMGGPGLCVIG